VVAGQAWLVDHNKGEGVVVVNETAAIKPPVTAEIASTNNPAVPHQDLDQALKDLLLDLDRVLDHLAAQVDSDLQEVWP
jgi:signal transduction protein with GAF and PtsI domain